MDDKDKKRWEEVESYFENSEFVFLHQPIDKGFARQQIRAQMLMSQRIADSVNGFSKNISDEIRSQKFLGICLLIASAVQAGTALYEAFCK